MRLRRGGAVPIGTPTIASTVAAVFMALSCEQSGATGPGEQARIYSLSAATQPSASAEAGTTVSPEPTVLALLDGKPIAGVRVDWTAAEGGSVSPASSVTDGNGRAFTSWTLGGAVGAQHLTASAPSLASVGFTTTATPGAVAIVVVSQRAVTLGDIGDTLTLRATAADRFNNPISTPALSWTSQSPSVVAVNSSGLLRGLAAGAARVVVTSGVGADTAIVEVKRPVGSVVVSPRTVTLNALGAKVQLSVVVKDRRGDLIASPQVTWQSSDSSIAAVSADGIVAARSVGRTTVVVRSDTVKDSVAVTVAQVVARVTVTPPAASVAAGDSVHLAATVADSGGAAIAAAPVAWRASDTTIARVGSGGWVRAVRTGSTPVWAVSGAVQGSATVTVVAGAVAAVTITPSSGLLAVGQTLQLTASFRDALGNVVPGIVAQWTSSDTTKATVSATGLVTARAVGSASIGASAGGKSATVPVTVTAVAAGPATRLAAVGTLPASAPAGQRLPDSVAVRATDAAGLPVSGVAISWVVPFADESVSPASSVTGNDGIARTSWTIGLSGPSLLEARSGSLTPVTFTVTAIRPRVARLVVTPDSVTLPAGGAPVTFTATAYDSLGKIVQPTLTWSADPRVLVGGGVSPYVGYSRYPGRALLIASDNRFYPVVADTAIVVVSSSYLSLRAVSGTTGTDTIGVMLPQTLTVKATAPNGTPMSGVRVLFETHDYQCASGDNQPYCWLVTRLEPTPGGSGRADMVTTTTDAAGLASVSVGFGLRAGTAPVAFGATTTVLAGDWFGVDSAMYTASPGMPNGAFAMPRDTVIGLGTTVPLRASAVDRGFNAVAGAVAFESASPRLTVTSGGVITGVDYGRGYVRIRPASGGGSRVDSVAVTVLPRARIAGAGALFDLAGGHSRQVYSWVSTMWDWSPSGDRLLLTNGATGLLSVGDTLGNAVPIAPRTDLWSAQYSKDGQWVYYADGTYVHRVHPDGTAHDTVTASNGGPASIAPDGRRLAMLKNGGVAIRDLQTGTTTAVPNATGGLMFIRWSPDGQWIAYEDGTGTVWVIHADGTGKRALAGGAGESATWSPDSRWVLTGWSLNDLATGASYTISVTNHATAWKP